MREAGMVVALAQGLARRAGARIAKGRRRPHPPAWLVRENKWRASRHGLDAEYVVSDDGTTEPARPYLARTLDELERDGHLVGNDAYVAPLRRLAQGAPTSAERQRAVFERSGSFLAVTQSLADEFEDDLLGSVAAG
jgi:glutamate---cysteine ligase / carboxylate-amine ligase